MESHSYIPLLIFFQLILLGLEAYFLTNWTRLAKERGWNPLAYRLPWFVSGILFLFLVSRLFARIAGEESTELDYYLFVAANIWMLPKLAIVPILFFKNFVLAFRGGLARIFKRKKTSPVEISELPANQSRRRFIQNTGWALAAFPFGVTAYGAINTLYDYKVFRTEVLISNLPPELDGLTIAQLSDVHSGSYPTKAYFNEVVRLVNSLNPDFIVITGDFINNDYRELNMITDGLLMLRAKYAVLGSLGNHDHYTSDRGHEQLINMLRQSQVDLLINESRSYEIKGKKLQFCGVDCNSLGRTFTNAESALAHIDSTVPVIMLCHDPREWDKQLHGRKIPLVLSGHTHGGQVGIETSGGTISPVNLVYKQYAGLYKQGDEYLYVHRGVGTVGPPVRIGVRPEIALITLRSPQKSEEK